MNSTDASDYSPLAYGTGLAIGLMLILGLPRESAEKTTSPAASEVAKAKPAVGGVRSLPIPRPSLTRPAAKTLRISSRP